MDNNTTLLRCKGLKPHTGTVYNSTLFPAHKKKLNKISNHNGNFLLYFPRAIKSDERETKYFISRSSMKGRGTKLYFVPRPSIIKCETMFQKNNKYYCFPFRVYR